MKVRTSSLKISSCYSCFCLGIENVLVEIIAIENFPANGRIHLAPPNPQISWHRDCCRHEVSEIELYKFQREKSIIFIMFSVFYMILQHFTAIGASLQVQLAIMRSARHKGKKKCFSFMPQPLRGRVSGMIGPTQVDACHMNRLRCKG
jgi:hypothetical protein